MNNHFSNLKTHIQQLQDDKHYLLQDWISTTDVEATLRKNGIQPKFFAKYFGSKVIDYALNVIEDKEELGDCPVIGVMLIFFQEKKVPLSDIYLICANLRNNFIQHFLVQNILTKELLTESAILMDKNFTGVIDEYIRLYYKENSREDKANDEHPPATLEKITTAKTYLNEIDLDESLIDELNELEIETNNSVAQYNVLDTSIISEITNLLKQYSKIITSMVEFQELSYAIILLSDLLNKKDLLELDEGTHQNILLYTKSILEDLKNWRKQVFIEQNAKDIHYLDKTLLSSIAQLQILLMPSLQEDTCEMEFF